ncbi:MAG: hypothetical protein JWP27_2829 [Flaviaesturariibacter sp.]|nr:hypothetical protein [Flaviaesturariibacter sp.]
MNQASDIGCTCEGKVLTCVSMTACVTQGLPGLVRDDRLEVQEMASFLAMTESSKVQGLPRLSHGMTGWRCRAPSQGARDDAF